MSGDYVIRLERGVWFKQSQPNGRTLVRENATRFPSSETASDAWRALYGERYPDACIGVVGGNRAWLDLRP